MCGIVGVFSFHSNSAVEKDFIISMRDTLVHRGPDGAGVWVDEKKQIGLGHRRLSIIDLSERANQPMSNRQKTLWLVFNGEIYNHEDIRKELKSLGFDTWDTDHSDSEVILYAFEAWGIECLHKFRGMFAFALWDANKEELWLVRDRIGVKPLYYSVHDQRLVFASEIKALLKDPKQSKEINEEAFYHYLSFLVSPAPQTLFKNIHKLPPGTWLKLNARGDIIQRKYWDVWDHVTPMTHLSEREITDKLLDELRTSVKLRKVSDVPVGVFLSGGIDSSTNAALFSENELGKVKTFSIGYQGEYQTYQNELHFAQMMAENVRAKHYEKLLSLDDLLNFLPEMVRLQDEPLADPVCVPVYYVSKLARDNGVVVAQVGEGSDELFWGYPTWKVRHRLQQYANLPASRWLKRSGMHVLNRLQKNEGFHFEFLRRSALNQPIFWGGAEAFTEHQKKRLLSDRLKHDLQGCSSWEVIEPYWSQFQAKAWDKSIVNWMSYIDLNMRLPELLLMRVDKMSMGVSLEGRVPFLDHKFVELALGIPSKYKTRNNELKYILKKAVRGIIPDVLIDRPKQGFGVPIYEWLFDKLGDEVREAFQYFNREMDFFDKEALNRLLVENDRKKIWCLFNFVLWWKEYIKS